RELPGRGEIHFGPRDERNQIEPFRGAAPQLAVGMRDERGAMPERSQPVHGQQHLVLAAPPGPRGIDVQGEHGRVQGSEFRVLVRVRVLVLVLVPVLVRTSTRTRTRTGAGTRTRTLNPEP